MSAPVSKPRWVNPCGLPDYDSSRTPQGTPSPQIFKRIQDRASIATNHAVDVKNTFIRQEFGGDPDIEMGLSSRDVGWFPPDLIPSADRDTLQGMPMEAAFKRAFKIMQYFAVGIEQLVLDQTLYGGGRHLSDFQEVENNLVQILCELQLGMHTLHIPPDEHVLRDIMSQEYRFMDNEIYRNVRDYLILREFIRASDFVTRLFGTLHDRFTRTASAAAYLASS